MSEEEFNLNIFQYHRDQMICADIILCGKHCYHMFFVSSSIPAFRFASHKS